jgi:hypothetical protein
LVGLQKKLKININGRKGTIIFNVYEIMLCGHQDGFVIFKPLVQKILNY